MSKNLSDENIELLQDRYSDLINCVDDDPFAPIEPMTYVDSNGDSLFHLATLRDDLNSVSILVDAGFDVNSAGDMGNTALHYAYHKKNPQMVELLKAAGARTDIRNLFGRCPEETP